MMLENIGADWRAFTFGLAAMFVLEGFTDATILLWRLLASIKFLVFNLDLSELYGDCLVVSPMYL